VKPLAPLLIAKGAIMNYWGDRHDAIEKDSFAVGDAVRDAVASDPLLGRIPYAPEVIGGIESANVAVIESLAYTAKDMGEAVLDGAETVIDIAGDAADSIGNAASDAWDWITD